MMLNSGTNSAKISAKLTFSVIWNEKRGVDTVVLTKWVVGAALGIRNL